jgi:hypothetical protein
VPGAKLCDTRRSTSISHILMRFCSRCSDKCFISVFFASCSELNNTKYQIFILRRKEQGGREDERKMTGGVQEYWLTFRSKALDCSRHPQTCFLVLATVLAKSLFSSFKISNIFRNNEPFDTQYERQRESAWSSSDCNVDMRISPLAT